MKDAILKEPMVGWLIFVPVMALIFAGVAVFIMQDEINSDGRCGWGIGHLLDECVNKCGNHSNVLHVNTDTQICSCKDGSAFTAWGNLNYSCNDL